MVDALDSDYVLQTMPGDRYSGNERRFRPELVETTSRSSRVKTSPHSDSQAPGINQNTPVEDKPAMDAERPRRILPQPTEISSRSSRKNNLVTPKEDPPDHSQFPSQELDSKKPVRPLPQPFEVKTSNSKARSQITRNASESENEEHKAKRTRRFLPEPIETVKMTRRKPTETLSGSNSSSSQGTPRKFTPQLIETGKRSFRRAETLPTPGASRGFATNGLSRPASPPASRGQQIVAARDDSAYLSESPFSYASLLRRQEGRQHSFRVPDLPAIPSNSSEDSENSELPSLSTTPSASSEESANRLAAKNRFRESCDERFSGYLLSLAARSAEKQLRDQALAAFPNDQEHQPVSHFAIDGDEEFGNEDIDPVTTMPRINNRGDDTFRRESITDLTWELEEMRRHKEVAELKDLGVRKNDAHESRFSAAAIAARQADDETSFFADWRRDLGLTQMRHAASPPMLGDDIVFAFSASPQGTACETDHHYMVPLSLAEPAITGNGHQNGLWTNEGNMENDQRPGLWMGLCHKSRGGSDQPLPFHKARAGIATPRPDIGGFDRTSFDFQMDLDDDEIQNNTDPQSVSVSTDLALSTKLKITTPEETPHDSIEHEFHDGFVTQVYNYLSLGYPSLARFYDLELSKISGIPVAELRKDDRDTDAKGYVAAVSNGNNGPVKDADIPAHKNCIRWKALRLYISEWARQQPDIDLNNDDSFDAWGVVERKGSWAV